MKDTNVNPAPEIPPVPGGDDQWHQDKAAFLRLLPTLLEQFPDRYVAVYQGAVVDTGEDAIELATRVYEKIGYVPLDIRRVTRVPPRPLRV